MNKILLTYLFVIIFFHCTGQIYTISGNIRDARTGEELIGASILIKEINGKGVVTNNYGFYSLSAVRGTYTCIVKFVGYASISENITLDKNIKHDFLLYPKDQELDEIIVQSDRNNENVTKTVTGVEKMDIKKINSIPVLMGEKDVLKTIQLLPGIKSAGEGSSGFYVRGGGADQNLIMLDEATVYNASHLMGFFSVFNSDAIKDATIYKGAIPSEFGGRLSSALDIKMKDGNNQKISFTGGIGLISSRLTIEGPIIKNKGSFIISGRRTYADIFLRLSNDTSVNKAILYFYDLNVKANYQFDDKNRLYLSGYFGKDVLGFSSDFGFDWGNVTGTLRFTHLFSNKMFSNTSFIYSKYNYTINLNLNGIGADIISKIEDLNLKQDFQYFSGNGNILKFGFNSIYHTLIPGTMTASASTSGVNNKTLPNKYAWENAVYFNHELKIGEKININYGLRCSMFSLLGPGDFNTYSNTGEIIKTETYNNGEVVKSYYSFEPRITMNYIVNQQVSVKAAYSRNSQNLHLLSNTTSGSPTDLWIPSSNNTKTEFADQFSLGYFRNLYENMYEFSIELYYKFLHNQIDYKNGANLNFNENAESLLLFGKGRAYGIELFLKKKLGKFSGWISYTLSRTERLFDEINNNSYFPAKQDRTHDLAIVALIEVSKKWTLSATWVFYTGNAVTFPTGKYKIANRIINLYTGRNAYRMPNYHRLDIGATFIKKKTAKFESSWSFSLYNVYARENAYTITFRQSKDNPDVTEAVQTTLFRIVPSFTYNFKF